MYVVKTGGTESWTRTYGGPGDDWANAVLETRGGRYVVAGGSWEHDDPPSPRIYLVKTDPLGQELWSYDYTFREQESAKSVIELASTGYLALTSSGMLRTYETGHYRWSATWETLDGPVAFDGWYVGRSINQTPEGGFLVAGSVDVDGDDAFDGFLLKLGREDSTLFMRGDTNMDGELDIADGVVSVLWLFGTSFWPACLDAMDANDDGQFNISDTITVLMHLFCGYGPLPEPFRACGPDPTLDDLDCQMYYPCL
jgi:hypothetical protein